MSDKLNEYEKKRDFTRTLEPQGGAAENDGSLRFVVQHHIARRDHYDLRLEWGGTLLSWAVPKGPSYNTRDKRLAVRVEDHPLEYRNFEGTIPKGEYGGGTVMIWDEGTWEPAPDVENGLEKGMLKFALNGRRLKGKWALVRMKPKESETKENWLLLKEKDEYAKTDDGISAYTTSIRSVRTMEEIERGEDEKTVRNPFETAEVQTARLVSEAPEGEDWLFELKYDGYRMIAFIEAGGVKLITRNGVDYTRQFAAAASSLIDWADAKAMVLDGEMVVADQLNRTDFQALQNYMRNPGGRGLIYIIFDILALDGSDLRNLPLIRRKEILAELMQNAPHNLQYSRHVAGNGTRNYEAACRLGMEGIVGKKADSVYSAGSNGDWIKLKCRKRQEFVIGGYTTSDKKISGVSSLLLGVYDENNLVYTGRAGTGFSESDLKELAERFKPLEQSEPPFESVPPVRPNERITWLIPELAAEIEFSEWTEDNLLRQASFKGLRIDKNPKDIKKEQPDEMQEFNSYEEPNMPTKTNESITIEGIKITNPDKVIFSDPEIKKADIIRYYAQVSERMMPYVRRRVLSVVRCPKGLSEACFYKKHPGALGIGTVAVPVYTSEGEIEEYFYIDNISGLVSEAQMGTLEFHTWGSRVDNIENPDIMVFDLDPDEGMDLETVRRGVKDMRAVLTELSLNSYLKTSGGKGYHVLVPLEPCASWDIFHDFARGVAEVMEKKWPERYTSNMRKVKRKNKIFVDWIRNARGATSVAPYSIRARNGAKVSMPIAWEELDTVAPDGVDMKGALLRISGKDPWKDFFLNGQRLK